MARSLRERGQVEPIVLNVNDKEQITQVLKITLNANDLLMTQGAGNVGQLCQELVKKWVVFWVILKGLKKLKKLKKRQKT